MSTIVAISTAPGIGGIGIIRMSGKECFKILEKIFIPKQKNIEIKGYSIKY
jgi:tRNA modification GTPase